VGTGDWSKVINAPMRDVRPTNVPPAAANRNADRILVFDQDRSSKDSFEGAEKVRNV